MKYTPKVHEQMLDELRRLDLRRYRRNLTKSFINYLKRQHSEDWGRWLKGEGITKKRKRGDAKREGDFLLDLSCGQEALVRASWETGGNGKRVQGCFFGSGQSSFGRKPEMIPPLSN